MHITITRITETLKTKDPEEKKKNIKNSEPLKNICQLNKIQSAKKNLDISLRKMTGNRARIRYKNRTGFMQSSAV